MPKKTAQEREREVDLINYYRWEFVRRNSDYQADFEDFVSRFGEAYQEQGIDIAQPVRREVVLRNPPADVQDYLWAFSDRWGVSWPAPPTLTCEPGQVVRGSSDYDREIDEKTPAMATIDELKFDQSIEELVEEFREHKRKAMEDAKKHKPEEVALFIFEPEHPTTVIIHEFFRFLTALGAKHNPYEVAFIFPEFEDRQHLGKMFFEYLERQDVTPAEHWKPLPPRRSDKRLHFDKYAEYLEAWDLRKANPELTWEELAQELYPDEYQAAVEDFKAAYENPAVSKARYRCRQAQELINGGFREIR